MGKKKKARRLATSKTTVEVAAAAAQVLQTIFYSDQSLGLLGNAQDADEEIMTLKAAIDTWDNSSFATIASIQRQSAGGQTGWQLMGLR